MALLGRKAPWGKSLTEAKAELSARFQSTLSSTHPLTSSPGVIVLEWEQVVSSPVTLQDSLEQAASFSRWEELTF